MEIIGMLALEMIGYYGEKKDSESKNILIVSDIKKFDDFNKKISELLSPDSNFDSKRISYANNLRNNGPSDHRNYWLYDIPAAMTIGTVGGRNPHYHKMTDTIETLNFKVLTQATNSTAFVITHF